MSCEGVIARDNNPRGFPFNGIGLYGSEITHGIHLFVENVWPLRHWETAGKLNAGNKCCQ